MDHLTDANKPAETRCPVCGQVQKEAGLRFCDSCGAPLSGAAREPRQTTSQQPLPGAAREPRQTTRQTARAVSREKAGEANAPMTPLAYFGSLILALFPVLGIFISLLWSRGHCRKAAKRDLARAVLAIHGVAAAGALVLLLCFQPTWKRLWRTMTTEPSTPVLAAPSPAVSPETSPRVSAGPDATRDPSPSESQPGSSIAEREIAGWDTGQPVSFSGFPSAKALNVLLGGKYYIKYTVFAFGATQEWEQAQLDGRSAEVSSVSGRKIRTLTMDGVLYECDDEKEIYCIAGQGTASNTTPFGGTLSALERIGGGEGQVNGVDCLYDEFLLQSTGSSEVKRTVRLYVRNEVLQAIYMEEPLLGGQVMMQVQVLTQDVPKNLLEFPASYTQVSYSEMVRPGAAL